MILNLKFLEDLARQAGEMQRAGFGQVHAVEYKGEIDIVTEVDRRIESFLLGEIRKHFPSHRILAEESGELAGKFNCIWYVDPVDGTVNYAHGVPIFAVSIAYAEEGDMRFGVVYDPMRDECFSAENGRGAWLNGERLQASKTAELDQSLLVTGFPYDVRSNRDNNLDQFTALTLLTQGVRRLGSAALDLCYVAAGRFDGFWELRLHAWDIAAGSLIATEAGAIVTDVHGGEDYLSPPHSIIAANPFIHIDMVKALNRKLDKPGLI